MLLKGAGMLTSCGHSSSSTHGNRRKAGGLVRGYCGPDAHPGAASWARWSVQGAHLLHKREHHLVKGLQMTRWAQWPVEAGSDLL